MNKLKTEKMNTKEQHYKEMRDLEERNRSKFNQHRSVTKVNISQNKHKVLETNKEAKKQIK
jgi:hypothetical protein